MSTPRSRRATSPRSRRRGLAGIVSLLLLALGGLAAMPSAYATSYARISGDGSSWAGNALLQWNADVKSQGVTVDYTPDGSSSGRKNFAQGLSDFAVSEIPYSGDTSDPQDTLKPSFDYSLLPVVAGGTSFMYNLQVNGSRYEQLKLSQAALAGIFSGQITMWNDPAIGVTNPGVNLPAQQITVVVRSDGSGATAQFTLWMLRQFPRQYAALCAKTGCNPHAATSYFPYQGLSNFTAQSGSNGVTTYTASTPYTINYDEYSYALAVDYPVVQLQNAAGFFVTPTATGVAVALVKAIINPNPASPNYLSQDLSDVYSYGDPRTYPISAYSYLVTPAQTEGNFDTNKGATLGFYSTYDLCEGQRSMGSLGYSPLPMNLVLAAMNQVLKIPGVDSATKTLIADTKNGVTSGSGNPCNNPTFQPGDDPAHNILIDSAPFPAGCNAACQAPWRTKAAGTNSGASGHSGGVKGNHGGGKGNGAGTSASSGPSPAATITPHPTGTTTGTTGTTSGGGVVPAGAAASPSCDADTGVCTVAGAAVGGTTTTEGVALAAAPAVITGESTWGGPQLAIAIGILFLLLVVIGPPVVSAQMDRRRGSGPGPGPGRRNGSA